MSSGRKLPFGALGQIAFLAGLIGVPALALTAVLGMVLPTLALPGLGIGNGGGGINIGNGVGNGGGQRCLGWEGPGDGGLGDPECRGDRVGCHPVRPAPTAPP